MFQILWNGEDEASFIFVFVFYFLLFLSFFFLWQASQFSCMSFFLWAGLWWVMVFIWHVPGFLLFFKVSSSKEWVLTGSQMFLKAPPFCTWPYETLKIYHLAKKTFSRWFSCVWRWLVVCQYSFFPSSLVTELLHAPREQRPHFPASFAAECSWH